MVIVNCITLYRGRKPRKLFWLSAPEKCSLKLFYWKEVFSFQYPPFSSLYKVNQLNISDMLPVSKKPNLTVVAIFHLPPTLGNFHNRNLNWDLTVLRAVQECFNIYMNCSPKFPSILMFCEHFNETL